MSIKITQTAQVNSKNCTTKFSCQTSNIKEEKTQIKKKHQKKDFTKAAHPSDTATKLKHFSLSISTLL